MNTKVQIQKITKKLLRKIKKINEDHEDDKPVPGPSAENEETLKQIQELENKVEK